MLKKCKPTIVYFPVDCKTGKAKKEYMKSSEIITYNIYNQDINNIPKLEDMHVTKLFLESITSFHSKENLANHFDITLEEFQSILESFGIE